MAYQQRSKDIISNYFKFEQPVCTKIVMLKKNKIIIAASIISAVALTLGLVLGGLDRLDVQKYGLNYNYITANFSDQIIYQGGLNMVGPSNVLLQVPKTYQTLTFNKLQTYTKDFFPLQLSVEARYIITLSPSNTEGQNFTILRSFYVNFSGDPEKIMRPLMKNEIVRIGSTYSSTYYQNASNYNNLENQIQQSITTILSKWANINVKVLLSSVVCKGVSFNLQALNRKISGLTSQAQRTQSRKTDMTNLINSLLQSNQLKMQIIKEQINRRISVVRDANRKLFLEPSTILNAVEAVSKNYSFSSSELTLRPQLYLIKNTSMF